MLPCSSVLCQPTYFAGNPDSLCHRLQPENMLIADATSSDPETPIKLADFGLSADISNDPLMHEPCGTPEYVGAFHLTACCLARELD